MKYSLSSLFVKGLISSFVIVLNTNATFAETYLIKDYPDSPLRWGDVGIWSTGSYSNPTAAVYIPGYYDELFGIDTRDAKIIFPGGSNDSNLVLNVDDNYTVAMFGPENGQYGVTMNMAGQLNEGANDSSITIKASDPAATTYDFIEVRSSVSYQEGNHELSYTAFNGGTVKLTGLNEGGTAQIKVSCNVASDTQFCPNHLTFSETTTFISESNLNIIGDTKASMPPMNLTSTVNLNGTTIIGANTGTDEEPVWNYKTLTIGTGSNPVQGTSLVANITGTLIANNLIQNEKTITNLSGTMDLVMPLTGTWNNSATDNESALRILGNFVMQDGGVLNITGSSSSYSNGAIYVGGGGSFVMESGSKATLDNAACRSTAYGSSK